MLAIYTGGEIALNYSSLHPLDKIDFFNITLYL